MSVVFSGEDVDSLRKRALERIDSPMAIAGAEIPDVVVIRGEPVDVRGMVEEARSRGGGGSALEAIGVFREGVAERRERISVSSDRDEIEMLVEEALGLRRAMVVLEHVISEREGAGAEGAADAVREKHVEDARRWLDFSGRVKHTK